MLDQFLAADIVVVGVPMYNFGIPSQLKAWFDHILIAGQTFRYGPEGPIDLAGGKRVIVAQSRGGLYAEGSPGAANEHAESHLRSLIGFIGITDLDWRRWPERPHHRRCRPDRGSDSADRIPRKRFL